MTEDSAATALHDLLVAADSAISHLRHRRMWPLDDFETDRLIGRLRKASETEIAPAREPLFFSKNPESRSGVSWLINSPAVLSPGSESWVGLSSQQAREVANALHTAGRFLRVFDGLAQDENDGTYALFLDADLFAAANALRKALAE